MQAASVARKRLFCVLGASRCAAAHSPPAVTRACAAPNAMPLTRVQGDLLAAREQYIVHQANCISQGARGLAQALFARFPYANVYARRTRGAGVTDAPGTITVCGDADGGADNSGAADGVGGGGSGGGGGGGGGHRRRLVVNLFGQLYPGDPTTRGPDTAAKRLEYFQQGLDALARLEGARSFAFPHLTGCGLGGGDWARYKAALASFADRVAVPVVLYHLPGGGGGGGGGVFQGGGGGGVFQDGGGEARAGRGRGRRRAAAAAGGGADGGSGGQGKRAKTGPP
ncbi:MAG: hypothetical protein J3K34DRAFT_225393 [Monoraphidium minutum]|nr:MAG: hypothetical protein J3K34DRAFT_225393 [Monoraphidium minutum]